MTGSVLFILVFNNFLSFGDFDFFIFNKIYHIGACSEATLLSFALASRINIYKEEKQYAQRMAIAQLQENQQLIRIHNQFLEESVEKKTTEILRKNEELEQHRLQQLTSEYKENLSKMNLAVLRAQMNPHFIFNCMNTLNYFILSDNAQKASTFLHKFSSLMRMVLENSQHETVSVEEDINALQLYVFLEQERFKNKFHSTFDIDPLLMKKNYKIPPLVLQPYVENAILHGLRHKQESESNTLLVQLQLKSDDGIIYCKIEDNGVGRTVAHQINIERTQHQAMGLNITKQRLELWNITKAEDVKVTITDIMSENKVVGTRVEIELPIIDTLFD